MVGIVNITTDSFSDGGRYLDPAAALAHARKLRDDGADVPNWVPRAWRLAALRAAGIGRDRLIIEPGLGYFLGSTPGPSLAALAGIRELKDAFGVPVLVSPSRKSFLRELTGRDVPRSGPVTLAAEIFAAWQGADYIRTHDVAAASDALAFLDAITGEAHHA